MGKVRPNIIRNIAENKIVAYLSEISYEIFIVHFWFLNGTWQISKYIQNMLLSDLVVVILTVVFAGLLHFASSKIEHAFTKINFSKLSRTKQGAV